jgi:hypothetical protein
MEAGAFAWAWRALAETPEVFECDAAARERATGLLGSDVAPQFALELSPLLLGERLLVCVFLLWMRVAAAFRGRGPAPAAESSESACASVSAPLASRPATSSVVLALLASFSNGSSIGHLTFGRLCNLSAHFKQANEVTAARSKMNSMRKFVSNPLCHVTGRLETAA